MNKYT